MRIALLSDIHGNLLALQAVLLDIERRTADVIVNLGDSLSGPLQPAETAAFLMAQPWVQLAGNHERQLVDFSSEKRGPSDRYAHAQLGPEVFEWMASLRHAQPLNDEVFLCHGSPRSDLEYFLDSVDGNKTRAASVDEIETRLGGVTAPVVACGHTHIPRIARSRSGQLLVNPGSVGLQAYADEHPVPHVVENGSASARYAILERFEGEWRAQMLSVRYDYRAAAEQARQHGRPDWEFALLHGRMR